MTNSSLIKNSLACCLLALLSLSLTACPKKQTVKKTTAEDQKMAQEKIESEELDIHGKDFESIPTLGAIRFDYDSSDLSDEARNALAANAAHIKKYKDIEVLTEGHCDERGTIAYNLALGQKRAQSVRNYYVSLGIEPKKIGTLSYGKEKPACIESSDACWSQNRRVESKIRALKVADNGKSIKKQLQESNSIPLKSK